MPSEDQPTHHGFKQLTADNWLEPDQVSALVEAVHQETGETIELAGEHWLEQILYLKLAASVPEEVRALFEVARGAMVYGWFFYPLYMLGAEQLTRVGEAAVAHKWGRLNAPEETETFAARVDWLRAHDHLSKEEEERWHGLRHLRNSASHPKRQSIINQAMALRLLESLVHDVNQLFKDDG